MTDTATNYLQQKIDYIEKEAEHHGNKRLFVLAQIETCATDIKDLLSQKEAIEEAILELKTRYNISDEELAKIYNIPEEMLTS